MVTVANAIQNDQLRQNNELKWSLRCAGLHNLLLVIWSLYFNKLTKLNIQFLITCTMGMKRKQLPCMSVECRVGTHDGSCMRANFVLEETLRLGHANSKFFCSQEKLFTQNTKPWSWKKLIMKRLFSSGEIYYVVDRPEQTFYSEILEVDNVLAYQMPGRSSLFSDRPQYTN